MQSFDVLAARRRAHYESQPLGPAATWLRVPNPRFDREVHERADLREARVTRWATSVGLIGAAMTVVVIMLGAWVMLGVLPTLLMLGSVAVRSAVDRRTFGGERHVRVPAAVQMAYTDYTSAVAALRAVDTNEEVVAQVEARASYMGDLVTAIGERSGGAESRHDEDGGDLCAQVCRIGAEAWALVQMNQHRHALADLAGDSAVNTKSLLTQAPASLSGAASIVAEETKAVEEVLGHLDRALDMRNGATDGALVRTRMLR